MGTLKRNSSKWIHETFPELDKFSWQAEYGSFAVSVSQADAVRNYIQNQEEHHRRVTFKEEYIQFLTAHGLEYDGRYMWR